MTSTDIAIRDSNGHVAERDVVDGWLAMASDVIKLANVIVDTEFVPEAYRESAPAIAAAILTGRELGIGPMTALRHIQMVKGVPTLSAEYKRARVLAAGHDFDILELNKTMCRVSGRRRGSTKPPLVITFTMDDAKTAGLLAPSRSGKPGAWQTRPRRMLFARAGSELCDFLFADVVNGLPTAEVMADGLESDELPEHQAAPAEEETEKPAAPKTAQRKPRTRTAARPYIDDGSKGINLPAYTGPPLPGEEEQAALIPEPDDKAPAWVGMIVRHFERLGVTDRDERLIETTRIAGRPEPVESTKDLTDTERKRVIDTLSRCRDHGQLVALLAEGQAPGREAPDA